MIILNIHVLLITGVVLLLIYITGTIYRNKTAPGIYRKDNYFKQIDRFDTKMIEEYKKAGWKRVQ